MRVVGTPGALALTYIAQGDPGRVRIPAAREPRIAERLWQHTCFEVFIRTHGNDAYHELNFSPSGEWAAFAFERYREGGPVMDAALDPRIAVRATDGTITLAASVPLGLLSPDYADAPLTLGLSAVIEDRDGALSYWALRHPPGKPNFHHAQAFALEFNARHSGPACDAGSIRNPF